MALGTWSLSWSPVKGAPGGVEVLPGGVAGEGWAGGDGEGAGAIDEGGFVFGAAADGSVDASGLLDSIDEEGVDGVGAGEGEVEGGAGGEAVGGGFVVGVDLGDFEVAAEDVCVAGVGAGAVEVDGGGAGFLEAFSGVEFGEGAFEVEGGGAVSGEVEVVVEDEVEGEVVGEVSGGGEVDGGWLSGEVVGEDEGEAGDGGGFVRGVVFAEDEFVEHELEAGFAAEVIVGGVVCVVGGEFEDGT